jgi:hypothetical protein
VGEGRFRDEALPCFHQNSAASVGQTLTLFRLLTGCGGAAKTAQSQLVGVDEFRIRQSTDLGFIEGGLTSPVGPDDKVKGRRSSRRHCA